jgi:chemotaxis protein MotB
MSHRSAALLSLLVAVATAAAVFLLMQQQRQHSLEVARRETARMSIEVAGLRAQVADLEERLEALRLTTAELEQAVDEREEQVDALRSARDQLAAELEQEIASGQVQVERLRDSLRVDLVDQVLFDSGEAELKPAGAEVLRRVGTILKSARDREILVQGHTDDDAIRGRLAERFPTNWELSSARAVNVVRFLQEELAVAPERLSALALSQYQPRADNSSEEGRSQNRRIEIVLAPLATPLAPEMADDVAPSATGADPAPTEPAVATRRDPAAGSR